MLDFYLRNRAHLALGPSRDESFYTLSHWHGRLRDSYGQFFNGGGVHLVALDPHGEQVIATCNFTNILMGAFKACHLGYAIDQAHQGQGLMQEIVEAGIDYLFRNTACTASWPATCRRISAVAPCSSGSASSGRDTPKTT